MDEEYKQSDISKVVEQLMDEEGYEFGEAVKKAMEMGYKDGGIMVAIENFNRGGMANGKTYHQYHDQYVPMDEESMMYANGGGVGSMMQPKKKIPQLVKPNKDGSRPGYRGPGGYQGGSGAPGSAESKGMGGDGGYSGGGQQLSGNDYRRAARDFVQTLNNNNAIRANQTGTKFTPYDGGSRPQGSGFGNFMSGIIPTLLGFVNPFIGMAARGLMGIPKGIVNFNNKIQNSDFGKSTSLADYLDMKSYGGFDERNLAAQKNMDEAAAITARLEGNTNIKSMPNVNITGLNNNDYEGEIGAMNNNDFVGLNTNATDMQNYLTDQANFTQPGITPTNLNDFEGIRSIPQLNNNDYQLGTPQLNNNDLEMGSPEMTMQDYLTDQANFQPYQTGSVPFSPALGNSNGSVNVESIINNKTPLTKSQEFYGDDVRPDFYPGDRLNEIEMENGVITKNTNKLVAPFRLANGGIINLLKG